MSNHILIFTTVPDENQAHKISEVLVTERLVACATVGSPCQSFYWWQGSITQDKEHLLILKTRESLYSDVESRLLKIHPYQVPEIIAIPIVMGSEKYLNWITEETLRNEVEE